MAWVELAWAGPAWVELAWAELAWAESAWWRPDRLPRTRLNVVRGAFGEIVGGSHFYTWIHGKRMLLCRPKAKLIWVILN